MRTTFNVNKELFNLLMQETGRFVAANDVRHGDLLITLMVVAREIIRTQGPDLPPEARALVIQACIARLTSEDQNVMVPGHTFQ